MMHPPFLGEGGSMTIFHVFPYINVAKCDCFLSRLAAALQRLQQQQKGN